MGCERDGASGSRSVRARAPVIAYSKPNQEERSTEPGHFDDLRLGRDRGQPPAVELILCGGACRALHQWIHRVVGWKVCVPSRCSAAQARQKQGQFEVLICSEVVRRLDMTRRVG